MQIINLDNKEQLNSFIASQKHSQFLQTWQWGEFHKIVSGDVHRFGVEDSGNLIGAATVIKKILPMNKYYYYSPRGPIIHCEIKEDSCKLAVNLLFSKVKELSEQDGAMFLRFDPIFDIKHLENTTFEKTLDVQPSKTVILDLSKTEAVLLKEMHQKTRYNIGLAEKKAVKIVKGGEERFEEFWRLMSETGERDDFSLHGINYYREMIKTDSDFIKLFFAEYRGKPLSAAIIAFFGDTAVYLHGASSSEDRNLMAPYLMQWECVKAAKKAGMKYYDFFGIDEKKWPGVTRFKSGFGGKAKKYQGTFDLPFDPAWYNIYKMIRKVRRTF